MTLEACGCIQCAAEQSKRDGLTRFGMAGGPAAFRFACEICGNKRCPHHTNHRLACTRSNEPGQKGSIYE